MIINLRKAPNLPQEYKYIYDPNYLLEGDIICCTKEYIIKTKNLRNETDQRWWAEDKNGNKYGVPRENNDTYIITPKGKKFTSNYFKYLEKHGIILTKIKRKIQ